MSTIEERLTALEQEFAGLRLENRALRNLYEIQSMALQSRVTQSELAKVRDTNNSVFDAIIGQNKFTNERLGDIQTQIIELDGKVVGMQTEMRQSFEQQDGKIVGMQTEMRQGFEHQEAAMNTRFDQITLLLTALAPKPDGEA
jgi:hypothetical protein